MGLSYTARFQAGDPDVLVAAALACPVCLRSETVAWEAALQGHDPSVRCSCEHCGQRWRLYLAPEQALRFGLMDRRG
jgi:hypothetical protein